MSRITMTFDDWLKEYKPLELNSDQQLFILPEGAEELRKYQTLFDTARFNYPREHIASIHARAGGYFGCLITRKIMQQQIEISFSWKLSMVLKPWDL